MRRKSLCNRHTQKRPAAECGSQPIGSARLTAICIFMQASGMRKRLQSATAKKSQSATAETGKGQKLEKTAKKPIDSHPPEDLKEAVFASKLGCWLFLLGFLAERN
jgi:hypothetical protein